MCIKSGLNGFGLNLGVPTENVLIRNITCPKGGRGGFALGSEMSGGMRNITFRDSVLDGERGIDIKPSFGRGGYMQDVTFENIRTRGGVGFNLGRDGALLMPGNDYVPLVANIAFTNVDRVTSDGELIVFIFLPLHFVRILLTMFDSRSPSENFIFDFPPRRA